MRGLQAALKCPAKSARNGARTACDLRERCVIFRRSLFAEWSVN